MGVAGLTYKHYHNDGVYLKSTISVSGNMNEYKSFLSKNDLSKIQIEDNRFEYYSVRLAMYLNNKLSARHQLLIGVIGSYLDFDMLAKGFYTDTVSILNPQVDNQGNTQNLQAYVQLQYRITDSWTLNTGLHYNHFVLNKTNSVEPRARITWQFTPRQKIGIALGIHSKIETLPVYYTQQYNNGKPHTPNRSLESTKAAHYVFSYQNQITKDLKLTIEPYYQYLYDIPVSKVPLSTYSLVNGYDISNADTLVNNGTGENYGLECTIEKLFSNNYYFLSTISIYESKYRDFSNREWNTKFNGNYILNILLGKEFNIGKNKKNLIGINGKFLLRGGDRYTPIDFEKSLALQSEVLIDSLTNTQTIKDYFRLDAGIYYRINRKKASHIISLNIQNVINRKNISGQYFDPKTNGIKKTYHTGLLPILNYKMEF